MRTILKWLGRIVVGLVVLIAIVAAFIYVRSEQLVNQSFRAPDVSITIPTDAASIERGHHLATVIADCTGCHGGNLAGTVVIDDPALGRIVAGNLTQGKNGLGASFSDADFIHAIRYGIKTDGHSVLLMPATDFQHLSDTDLADVIAYVKSLPPADSSLPATALGPLGRVLLVAGQLPLVIAPQIDQSKAGGPSVTPAVSAEYGKYVVSFACAGCHGEGLSGGQVPGTPPSYPKATNLTPSGEVGAWTEADFQKAIRTGVMPNGEKLNKFMPYEKLANLTDDEVQALWLYVHSVPARPDGTH
jgi:mono/diheme cytochrome c family protein